MATKLEQALESGTIQFPRGLTGEERRAFIKEKLVDSVEKTRRKLFNDYFDITQSIAESCGNSLGQYHRDLMESAFNAVLDAVVIELPELKNSSSYYDGGEVHDCAINHCRYNIESLNLGIKIK